MAPVACFFLVADSPLEVYEAPLYTVQKQS